ncbi:MAG TPA: cation:proton antiporter [Patescibacteria group bacterium]|nr:cation:proton antiporter [Patescibacteria group bacterium]
MHLFAEFAILVGIATAISLLMRLLKQPLVIGHIITGLIVGPFVLGVMDSPETFALFSEIGIAILLFTVGLNLSPQIIRDFGKVSLVTALAQVAFTFIAAFILCIALGQDSHTAFYISAALAFSSTIIVLKLIADKGDMDVLYAKIAVGFLVVQDLLAILLLFVIPIMSMADASYTSVLFLLLKGVSLILLMFFGAYLVLPKINRFISQSQELLFLFAIAWGMGIAELFRVAGFSLESGALLAGVALSNLPLRHEVSARLTPLRDFFIILFFIVLGSQMKLSGLIDIIPLALALSVVVFLTKPFMVMTIMGMLGYRRKTSLQTGITVAQISEFSFILGALGLKLGHIDQSSLSLITFVGLITIFVSTFCILHGEKVHELLAPFVSIFERKHVHEKKLIKKTHSVILFGCNRIGYDFIETFSKLGKDFLVVDYNPETIEQLSRQKIETQFGDAGDFDFLETIDFARAELVISTIPDSVVNQLITKAVKESNPEAIVLVVAHQIQDALHHYDQGVDYVVLPHFLGGRHAAELVVKFKNNPKKYSALRKEHLEYLRLKVAIGHEHPRLGHKH